MAKRRKSVRSITTAQRESLSRLANLLYDFLPLTASSKNTVTFKTLFKESSVEHYLDGPRNKQQALEKGFTELYRFHKQLPKIIIRKVIPAAINYRKFKRKPLTKAELQRLSSCLVDLGIDMNTELCNIKIDDQLPRITVPPVDLKERLRNHDLVEYLSSEPLQLFEDGHFNEAVRRALEKFENRVYIITNQETSGQDLMAKAFANDRFLDLTKIALGNHHSFITGYRFLSMGAMSAIRNIFSHGDEERRSPEECFEMLLFVNWMFRYLVL